MKTKSYPFSAIVGQEPMKTALLLNAVDPSIGGVLIRGEKGTAKSTAVRSLAALLPELQVVPGCVYHCAPDQPDAMCDACRDKLQRNQSVPAEPFAMPLVDLPLGATEDRVAGTIHLEQTLKSGQRQYEAGLLAAANRGILYVDEVNLLEDHLIDLLLDAAASGINRVEREGLCVIHPARFMLIGTMNPEEGELRPQFLDRFGLTVIVEGLSASSARRELLRRRLAFDQNPQGFQDKWAEHDRFLQQQIVNARVRLEQVRIPDKIMNLIVDLVIDLKIQGHRADICLLKSARALSALLEKDEVGIAELEEVAGFVLPHRLPGSAMLEKTDAAKLMKEAFERLAQEQGTTVVAETGIEPDELDYYFEEFYPGAAAAGSMLFEVFKKKSSERLINIDESVCTAPLALIRKGGLHQRAAQQRRRQGRQLTRSGRHLRSTPLTQGRASFPLDLAASWQAGVLRHGRQPAPFQLLYEDLRQKICRQPQKGLIVLVVDASESMGEGTVERMKAAKGAILGLLTSAYQMRDQIALVAFRGQQADVLLRPTSSVQLARASLRQLPVGGATPMADGLLQAWQLIRVARQRQPGLQPQLVLITDGEANVPLTAGHDVKKELNELATSLQKERLNPVVIDSSTGVLGNKYLRQFSQLLQAPYHHVRDLHAGRLFELIQKGNKL